MPGSTTPADQPVAAGGSVMNGGVLRDGHVTELRLPGTWPERVQIVEYAPAFLAGRSTFGAMGILLVISGAFGLFGRSDVMDVGGFLEGTVGSARAA